MKTKYDVLAIGNALVDILSSVDDKFITDNNMEKGAMQLIEQDAARNLYKNLNNKAECSGGSAANTAVALASLGGTAKFIGKVSDDDLGHLFAKDLKENNVEFAPIHADSGSTGCSTVLVTPDAERTMNTFLGVAPDITKHDITEQDIIDCRVLYIEGYLWDKPDTIEAIKTAIELAHKHGKDIAFSLSDPFCVERHHDAFRELIEEYVTILFANEDEARALFQVKEFGTAVEMAADRCRIACITRGNNGSVIAAGVNRHSIDAITDITVVDTTGAGDLYAGGFLYGYIHGYNLQRSGQIATLCSTEIIQHIGARPKSDLKKTLGTL